MKFFLLFQLFISSLFAVSIDDSLLKVHATLVPKICLMDYQFKNKLVNNTIVIAIVYNNNEYLDAKSLQKKILQKYTHGIKSYNISPKLVSYKDVENFQANIYYLLPSSKSEIKKVVQTAKKEQALTFSYLTSALQNGVMISLNISKKIKPILNLRAIKKNHISLRPILIDISTIFMQDSNSALEHYLFPYLADFRVYKV